MSEYSVFEIVVRTMESGFIVGVIYKAVCAMFKL